MDVVGDMPRGKQFGYLFSGSTTQTYARRSVQKINRIR
jgi:hypothetical protein